MTRNPYTGRFKPKPDGPIHGNPSAEYERRKQQWAALLAQMTPEQYEATLQRLAKECGL